MAVDYLSKLVEEKALPTNDARVVCKFLKSLFARFGTPSAIISDRGTHFCNEQFAKVMLKYDVTHRLTTACHPHTSGQVEASNHGLKRILERTVGENRASWSDKLDDALWAFHTAFKTPIGCTPYKLVYEKACHLLMELEHKADLALKHCNYNLLTAGDHRKVQLNELNELRDQAYENSLIYKKTKRIHDFKIKDHVFNVDPTTAMNMALALMAKAFKLNDSTPTNNNQRISSNPRNRQIAQPRMDMGQDRKMQMVEECCLESKDSECWKSEWFNWCLREWKLELDWEWGVGHYARNCTVRPRRRDAAYLQTQLLIAQKEEAGIQLQAEELTALPSMIQTDQLAYMNDDNEIFNMFTQEEQYTKLLEPIPESHQVPQNDNDVIFEDTSVEQGRETVEQHPANFEETHLLNDTTPSVARKFLNEVKSTIVTLQRVVKQRMTIETHNWASSAYQELQKIIRDENFPIVNQVDARVQNFKLQFLKEAAKFVGDFKSLAKEADDSLAKHKALELEIERLLRAVVSQDVMNIVQKKYVVDTSDLQTELERTKERFENCIIKKKTEYAKL
nr:reverse transcriptase domain-containing protein [Tanacetum cinerariifolium]